MDSKFFLSPFPVRSQQQLNKKKKKNKRRSESEMAETSIISATGEEFFGSTTAHPTAPASLSSLSSSAASSSSIPKIKYQSSGSFDSSMFASSSIPTFISKRPPVQSSASLHSSALLHSKLPMHLTPSLQPQYNSASMSVHPQQPHPHPHTQSEPNKPLQEFQAFLSQNKFASESEKISRLLCRLNHGQAVWRFEATDSDGDIGDNVNGCFWNMPGSLAFKGIVRYDSDGGGEEATVHYEDALVIVEKTMKVASSASDTVNDNDNDLLHCLVEPVSVFPSSHQLNGDQRRKNSFKFILLSSHLLLVKK